MTVFKYLLTLQVLYCSHF